MNLAGRNSSGTESLTDRWVIRGLAICGLGLCAAALVLIGLSLISLETLREYGQSVRRAEDVSVERFARFQQVCWFLSASLASLGVFLWCQRRHVSQFIQHVWRPVSVDVVESSPRPPELAGTAVWLTLILCVGAALRLLLFSTPMAYDESYSWVNFASRPLIEALGDLNSTNNHLFNTLCMFVTGRLFGPQEWALRIGVMSCGLATLPVCFVWARRWLGTTTALLTTAMMAVSSLLVTYSADARGYEYVLLAALLLDDALAKQVSQRGDSERCWVQAGVAIIVGVWSMIIMGYAILASVLWFLLNGSAIQPEVASAEGLISPGRVPPSFWQRLAPVLVLGWITALGSSLIYIPGYIIRGTLFLHDPVMRQATSSSLGFLGDTMQGLIAAWRFSTNGALPTWLLGAGVLIGIGSWPRDRRSFTRLLAPFLVVVTLNLVRHVNPPPRIYLWLMPWVCLMAAHGLVSAARLLNVPRAGTLVMIPGILGLGCWHAATHWPVLLSSDQRSSYVSLPEVVRRLQHEVASAPLESHRLIAPLPCDLPAIFYMDRSGFRVPHNGIPQSGERLWLIARREETPSNTLNDSLVQLSEWEPQITNWTLVDHYQTLTLYTARVPSLGTVRAVP